MSNPTQRMGYQPQAGYPQRRSAATKKKRGA